MPHHLSHLLLFAHALSATQLLPNQDSARANSHRVFNAIDSAGRQWGSAVNHNGFGFFSVVVPEGTLFYHGSPNGVPPEEPDWLAFEVEHAEAFGQTRSARRRGDEDDDEDEEELISGKSQRHQQQKPLQQPSEPNNKHSNTKEPNIRLPDWHQGHLHTYQTTAPLTLLYADGMSAAKASQGTLDSQDLLLRGNKTGNDTSSMGEPARARDVCRIISRWGYAGMVRMEAGFEIMYCDFSLDLRLLSARRTFSVADRLGDGSLRVARSARAVAERYDGLGVDRLRIDFSSMVSGFFFPINISSTDPSRPDLVRLEAAGLDNLSDIKAYLARVASQPRRFTLDWQAVTDMIVRRYANRLVFMASGREISDLDFINELEESVLLYIDAPPPPEDDSSSLSQKTPIQRCTQHFLLPSSLSKAQWTESDTLIHTAIESVTHDICNTLFSIHISLVQASHDENLTAAVAAARRDVEHLTQRLAWSEWRKVRRCPVGELMFAVMWPWGTVDDYWHPGCRRLHDINRERRGYWNDLSD
ncbi:hypothetical protein CDD80_1966 [Ophiocordyceps camponoti-rufipedis]|uniref:Uncharacterized protein n=1 Tax=Ophiocordyceps camponoti-rufipedis TaxID=2004952 RepID=A0A2C5ZH27_9HYPO|nr:hypothetical protein CDD80_1966 [Ophiocordyceps camponoti-rufipedis]